MTRTEAYFFNGYNRETRTTYEFTDACGMGVLLVIQNRTSSIMQIPIDPWLNCNVTLSKRPEPFAWQDIAS